MSESIKNIVKEELPIIEPPSPESQPLLSCPVCLATGKFHTEEDLSKHVEECLSKQEIASILKSDKITTKHPKENKALTSKKRKSEEMIGRLDKRWNHGSNKINSYFKPKIAHL